MFALFDDLTATYLIDIANHAQIDSDVPFMRLAGGLLLTSTPPVPAPIDGDGITDPEITLWTFPAIGNHARSLRPLSVTTPVIPRHFSSSPRRVK